MQNTTLNEKYNDTHRHFDKTKIPKILSNVLQPGSLSIADIGCGDGPWFYILTQEGHISPDEPVYAVDLEIDRLRRTQQRFPWITTVVSSADAIPDIKSESLDWVISTMVMEHVLDEVKYLKEISRLLKPQGKAYITTVYKRKWAWYFRKRNGESVLDRSHLREYTDFNHFCSLISEQAGFNILNLELKSLWFPVIDPLLFRLGSNLRLNNWILDMLRFVKIPILGYYELHVILSKINNDPHVK